MLLVADVGNTNTVFGLYAPSSPELVASWRAATRQDRMPDEWFALLTSLFLSADRQLDEITAVVIASVVPSVTTWLSTMAQERLGIEPVSVGPHLDLGLTLQIDNASELGADRIVDMIAAYARYGGPTIVIDLGTATKFEVISAEGHYLGGAITPGLVISLDALAARAARLFAVELALPPTVIGTNTVTQMQSGIVYGYLSMLEGMIVRIHHELGFEAPVVVTGGYADLFADASPLITHHDPDLPLEGLRLVYERLRSGRTD